MTAVIVFRGRRPGTPEPATNMALRDVGTLRRLSMPGDFIQEVRIYKCGTTSDGGAIMCSEIGWAKVPFMVMSADSDNGSNLGWQEVGHTDIHIPLKKLVSVMKQHGIDVRYDEEELARRIGPAPEAVDY
ncbi:hypothetical protein ACQP2T_26970 [Nonomuraea sp. CA-143628]|uniref:hypothetical protein n=1 Tax=Nonomuraea sp. CA-143628 TaxID=3239997 RepID=UPI003D8E6E00